jgi:hypothetical protein
METEHCCWWCDKHIYTMVFWTINHGWQEETNVDQHQEESLIRQIENANDRFACFEWTGPMFFSTCTDWRPVPLLTIQDFMYMIDSTA